MIRITLLCVAIFLPIHNIFAVDPNIDRRYLRVQYLTEEYPPYNFTDDKGVLRGIAVDLLEAMLKELNLPKNRSNFISMPWARAYNNAQNPKMYNMVFSTTRTPERETLFKWVGPIADTTISVFRPKGSPITIANDAELRSYTFGVIRGDIGGLLLGVKGIDATRVQQSSTVDALLKKVLAKRVQLFAYEENVAKWLIQKLGYSADQFEVVYELKKGQVYYAFNINVDDEIIAGYQAILDKLNRDPSFIKNIKAKYISH